MFANRTATAMLGAKDLKRAVAWYRDKLGIEPDEVSEYGANYTLGGGLKVFMYPTQYAGTAEHTLLSFTSDDLVSDMQTMRERGVEFLDYDLPGLKTENGVAQFGPVKNAWTKDSEGNILGFVEGM